MHTTNVTKFGGVIILDTSPEFNHCDIVLDKKKTFKLVGLCIVMPNISLCLESDMTY